MIATVLNLIVGESRLFGMDFTKLLASDETISSITSITCPCTDLTISGQYIDGPIVYFRLESTTACHRCNITVEILTSDSNTLIDTGQLKISEV